MAQVAPEKLTDVFHRSHPAKPTNFLQIIRRFIRFIGLSFSGTKVADILGVPKQVQAAVVAARAAGTSAMSFLFDEKGDSISPYKPDAVVESFKTPVMNPVVAFQEALEADGDRKKCSPDNPFAGQKLSVREAWLFEAHVDSRGQMLTDKKKLESMREKWPLPYRLRHVEGTEAFKEAVRKADQTHKSMPERARKSREARGAQEKLIQRMKEDGFANPDFGGNFGPYDQNQYTEFVPLTGGPYYRQLYIYDFLKQIAYAFEAQNHNPVAKAILRILVDYAFGRRFDMRIKDSRKEKVWQDHDRKYKITKNICEFWAKEAEMYGDFILDTDNWRSVDPSTVWDIITNPDNINEEYYYYQSYPTAFQMFTGFRVAGEPGSEKQAASEYIIRQVPAFKMLHMRINCVSNEKRGRSTLFPILGWLKRVKDLYNSAVIREWLYSSFIWDVTVKGSASDVNTYASAFPNMPQPGSPYIHNEAVTLAPMQAMKTSGQTGGTGMGEELLSFVAVACGIPKEFLNVVSRGGGSRAQALTTAEPFTKVIESIQGRWEWYIKEIFKRVMEQNGLDYSDGDVEILFPSVTKDTTTETIKNIAQAEGMGWIAKRTAAEMAAKELNITEYDFVAEQKKIKDDQKAGLDLPGQTPLPPEGRFGGGGVAGDDDSGSDIHGEGRNDLVGDLTNL